MNLSQLFSALFAIVLVTTAIPTQAKSSAQFVKTNGTDFVVGDRPYQFLGTNLWYGINLGSPGPSGDRPRLVRELDRLAAMGVKNLRVMAASEGPNNAPFRMLPALQPMPGVFDPNLLAGLDFLLVEMAKRDMRAIMCLGNFWQWSGGFAQYVSWVEGSAIPYPEQFGWSTFENYAARFYANPRAVALYNGAVDLIVSRINSLTLVPYSLDPTIMSWELANEPRGQNHYEAYVRWVTRTASRIKHLDPHHLVTTGSEGLTASPDTTRTKPEIVHAITGIDYLTFHIWIQNFGWYDPRNPASYEGAIKKALDYVDYHVELAAKLGKPAVFEEFGIARDLGDFTPTASTETRDRYYQTMFDATLQHIRQDHALSGVNFWAWSGEARPVEPGGLWRPGTPYTGDPPHEPQGWYSVYDRDLTTIAIIKSYAASISLTH
ncbi:MAG: mannanase [Deltaproteobacteria bacterium]|nr:mannanase [Deltaproteobacteria bacterium]